MNLLLARLATAHALHQFTTEAPPMCYLTLDRLLDDMLCLTDAQFAGRHTATKREARVFLEEGIVPAGWRTVPLPDTSTRPADRVAEACYFPPECEVCGMPPTQGSVYCSDRCERIMTGRPSVTDQMADL